MKSGWRRDDSREEGELSEDCSASYIIRRRPSSKHPETDRRKSRSRSPPGKVNHANLVQAPENSPSVVDEVMQEEDEGEILRREAEKRRLLMDKLRPAK